MFSAARSRIQEKRTESAEGQSPFARSLRVSLRSDLAPFLARKGARSDDASLIETLDATIHRGVSEGMVERGFRQQGDEIRGVQAAGSRIQEKRTGSAEPTGLGNSLAVPEAGGPGFCLLLELQVHVAPPELIEAGRRREPLLDEGGAQVVTIDLYVD